MKKFKGNHEISKERHEKGIERIVKNPKIAKLPIDSEFKTNFEFEGQNSSGMLTNLEIDIIAYNENETNFIEYKGSARYTNSKKAKSQLSVIRNNLDKIPEKYLRENIHYIYIAGNLQETNHINCELKGDDFEKR